MNTKKSDATVIADAKRLLANLAKKESSGGYTQDALRSAWYKAVNGPKGGSRPGRAGE